MSGNTFLTCAASSLYMEDNSSQVPLHTRDCLVSEWLSMVLFPNDSNIIWTGQDYPTGNSTRRETKRQIEKTTGRQNQRVDWL